MVNVLSWLTGREDKTGQPPPLQYDDGQPSLRAYNPAPSEQFSQWMAGLLGAGPGASLAKQNFATGVPSLLAASPLGIGLSAADLIHAKNANDPMGAAAAAIGMVPGLKPEVQAVRQGIRAYHGSPHDFDRFDISKIGTGEGAQVYGHGLYFAENEGVARAYREQLAGAPFTLLHPEKIEGNSSAAELARRALKETKGDYQLAMSDLTGLVGQKAQAREAAVLINSLRDKTVPNAPGKMYEVNINAKPEQFLDWDKPISQQKIPEHLLNGPITKQLVADDPGALLYQALAAKPGKWQPYASEQLKEAGIPGIRYLDQGSRASPFRVYQEGDKYFVSNGSKDLKHGGPFDTQADAVAHKTAADDISGTRNYVLFNDQLVDIMRKYGLAAPAAAGAASYAMAPQEAQAGKAQPAQFQPPVPLSDKINQMIDGLQWGDQWQGRMRLPLQNKVNQMLGESVWPPLR